MRDSKIGTTARRAGAHAGQALTEFVLIVTFVALVTIPAITFLRDMTAGMYVRHQQTLSAPVDSANVTTP